MPSIVCSRFRPLDQRPLWDDRVHVLQLVDVVEEAPDVRTFTFVPDPPAWFRYAPGQFITLELPAAPEPLLRTYTLSSSPSRPLSVAVTAKVQPGSVGTRWMFDSLRPGDSIRAHGPTGEFSLHCHGVRRPAFLSGGSGVTPMISMLRWLSDCEPLADVAFVQCARRPEDIIFRSELELLARRMPHLTLSLLVEERGRTVAWSGHVGRLDGARLMQMVPDLARREVYCCGPGAFMQAVREILRAEEFDPAFYYEESFLPGSGAAAKANTVDPPSCTQPIAGSDDAVEVHFTRSGAKGSVVPSGTVLQAARALGVRIPAACESGLCGTCKVRKLSGVVDMTHRGGILEDEIAAGYILACCSRPRDAVEIEA